MRNRSQPIALLLWLTTTVALASEPVQLPAFVSEMTANPDFQRASLRGFKAWDDDVDGQLSRQESEGKSGVFLTTHRFDTHDLDANRFDQSGRTSAL